MLLSFSLLFLSISFFAGFVVLMELEFHVDYLSTSMLLAHKIQCYNELGSTKLKIANFLNSLEILLTSKIVSKLILFCKKFPKTLQISHISLFLV